MKIFSKFILTVLCANLTFSCFAGNNLARERAEQKDEREQRENRQFMVGAGIAVGVVALGLHQLLNRNNNDRVQPVAQRVNNDAVEERKEQSEPIRRPIALAPASSSVEAREQYEGSCSIAESACRISKNASSDLPSIKLDDSTLNSLRNQFDNKLMTPSCWGPSKNITFNYQHIFGSKRKGKNFLMGHTDANNILYDYKPFGIKFAGYGPCESYGYRWGDRETLNTFFPDNWEPNKIISKINEVMKNGMTTIEQQQNSIARQGKTSEGLTIKIVFEVKNGNPTGKVKTAYPIID